MDLLLPLDCYIFLLFSVNFNSCFCVIWILKFLLISGHVLYSGEFYNAFIIYIKGKCRIFVNTGYNMSWTFHSPKRIKICKIKIYENKFPGVQLNYCDRWKLSHGYYLMQKGQSTSWGGPIKIEQPNQWQTTNYKDSHTRVAYQVKEIMTKHRSYKYNATH